jgi:hypothetical protein
MKKTFKVWELKHEDKVLGKFTVRDGESAKAELNTIFLSEYGGGFMGLLDIGKKDGFSYDEVDALEVGKGCYTHYIRNDWTIDVQRIA